MGKSTEAYYTAIGKLVWEHLRWRSDIQVTWDGADALVICPAAGQMVTFSVQKLREEAQKPLAESA